MTVYMLISINTRCQKSATYWALPDILLACWGNLLQTPYMWLVGLHRGGTRCESSHGLWLV